MLGLRAWWWDRVERGLKLRYVILRWPLENYQFSIFQVLYAAAWICGEFSTHLERPQETLEAMLRGKISLLPGKDQNNDCYHFLVCCCKLNNETILCWSIYVADKVVRLCVGLLLRIITLRFWLTIFLGLGYWLPQSSVILVAMFVVWYCSW